MIWTGNARNGWNEECRGRDDGRHAAQCTRGFYLTGQGPRSLNKYSAGIQVVNHLGSGTSKLSARYISPSRRQSRLKTPDSHIFFHNMSPLLIILAQSPPFSTQLSTQPRYMPHQNSLSAPLNLFRSFTPAASNSSHLLPSPTTTRDSKTTLTSPLAIAPWL